MFRPTASRISFRVKPLSRRQKGEDFVGQRVAGRVAKQAPHRLVGVIPHRQCRHQVFGLHDGERSSTA